MTHKDSYPWLLFGDIPFRWIDPFFVQLPSAVAKELTTLGPGSASAKNRLGNIDRTLKASADKNSRARGHHRMNRIGFTESVGIELDAKPTRQAFKIGRRIQSNGQNHHVEFFLFYAIVGSRVFYSYILAFRVLSYDGCVASDKPNPGKVLCSLVESLKILPK